MADTPLTASLSQTPMVDKTGRITLPWRQFFDQYIIPRIGGSLTAPSLPSISADLAALDAFVQGLFASIAAPPIAEPSIALGEAMARQEIAGSESLPAGPAFQLATLESLGVGPSVELGMLGESLSSFPS